MAVISARVEEWLKSDVEAFWRQHGERPAPGFRRVMQEWWTAQRLPLLAFRDGPAGRRAVIQGGPDVWEVEMVAREVGRDPATLAAHFGGAVSVESLAQALDYVERFGTEIEAALDENARIARLLGAP